MSINVINANKNKVCTVKKVLVKLKCALVVYHESKCAKISIELGNVFNGISIDMIIVIFK